MIPGLLKVVRSQGPPENPKRMLFGPVVLPMSLPASYAAHVMREAAPENEAKEFLKVYIDSLEVVDQIPEDGDLAMFSYDFYQNFGLKSLGLEVYPQQIFGVAASHATVNGRSIIIHDIAEIKGIRLAKKKKITATNFRPFSKNELSAILPSSEKLYASRAFGGETYYRIDDDLEA